MMQGVSVCLVGQDREEIVAYSQGGNAIQPLVVKGSEPAIAAAKFGDDEQLMSLAHGWSELRFVCECRCGQVCCWVCGSDSR